MQDWRTTFWRILSWVRLDGADLGHLFLGTALWEVSGLWWLGVMAGGGLELVQFLVLDRRRWMLGDRVIDVCGYAVTIAWALEPAPLVVLAWYLLLVGLRHLERLYRELVG